MDPQKSSKSKNKKRGKISRSRTVGSSNDSSTDEKSDEESRNLGSSRLHLLQDKRKSSQKMQSNVKSISKSVESDSSSIQQLESADTSKRAPVASKESSIAQSIKRKFGFFRRSAEKSADDVEAAASPKDTPEQKNPQRLDVVVDVHCENENPKSKVIKKNVTSKSSSNGENNKLEEDSGKSPSPNDDNVKDYDVKDSLDLIEEFHEERMKRSDVLESESESEVRPERTSEVLATTSGGESSHRRRRWDKSEISAEEIVEDLKKPRRRQWAKGATSSAQIRKSSGQKLIVPKRAATAEPPRKPTRPRSSLPSKPVAAPRSKNPPKKEKVEGFDNDGFSSDHDEVLRIETVNNSSPKIKYASRTGEEKIKDATSTLSEEDEKLTNDKKPSIEEIEEYLSETGENSDNSDNRDQSVSAAESSNFAKSKRSSRKHSSNKRKTSIDKRSIKEDEDDDLDEDEEDQETVLNVAEKKSRKSSSSSKIEIIPSKFFERESSDETTISTNEEMHTSRRGSRHSASRSKSKSSKSSRRDDAENGSERSSRTRRKTTSSSTRNSAEETSSAKRKVKSRTKKRSRKKEKDTQPDEVVEEEEEEELKYASIRIHRCDMLEADYITRHPMVRVHLVYADSGEYPKARDEEQNDNDEFLQPMDTDKFDFKEKKTMVPVWEEELIFRLNFKDILAEGKAAILILFEILDLLSFAESSTNNDHFGKDNCWHKVAWAFLRPVGIGGIRHVDKKVRLQLYRPKKSLIKAGKNKCEVYKWWKSNSRDKYPSSLYITVSSVDPPKLEPVFFEQPLELTDLAEMPSESRNVFSPKTSEEQPAEPLKWTRLAAQSCQIPNEIYLETEAGENGSFYVAFSNDGKYLACVLSEEYDFPIVVYKIDEGKVHVRFSGHKNFVYALNWSQDDRYLLSVSSDQTARLWDVQEQLIENIYVIFITEHFNICDLVCGKILPHPAYVYCGKFAPNSSNYIVTGCYDHVARVWARLRSNNSNRQYELVQELEGHESFVNAVCFQAKEETCLTGDGLGVILVWTMKRSRRSPIRREWQIARKIKIREIEGVPINSLLVHPLGSRLLVHSRNNELRLIDAVSGAVVKKFEGLRNQRIQITACISPCGSLLFCGGEDSTLNVWGFENGKLLAIYEISSHNKAVTCVDYHPYDHVIAFATYGSPIAVKILKFDREADGKNVGLKSLAMTTSGMSFSSRLKDHPLLRNGIRNLELSARSLDNSTNVSQIDSIGHLLSEYKDDEQIRRNLKGKLQHFIESGPNFKTKSMTRLNGIIEKIDRILMYATSQKSPAVDLESARNTSSAFDEKRRSSRAELFELKDFSSSEKRKNDRKIRKQRHRSRSARNACSPTPKEAEFSKAFSDSAAFTRKVSRFSDDNSSNSNPSLIHGKFIVERLDLEKVDGAESESGFKDSLDTIIDGKEDFPSEEILDVESLKSDDTYVVSKEKTSPGRGQNDDSDKSNATFVIESEVPIPKPRKKIGRIEVM